MMLMWLAAMAVSADGDPAGRPPSQPRAVYEDAASRIEFDERGGLDRITNRRLGDECLKGGRPGAMPFRLYADPTNEFVIGTNAKFQLVFDDPAATALTQVSPETCRLAAVRRKGGLMLHYQTAGLDIRLRVRPVGAPGVTDWSLAVTNTGTEPREFLADFPCLDGVRLGPDPARNMATAMDQAGLIVPAWERPGGVLGESNQFSMQWHAVWDPTSRSALALLFMDPDVRSKRLVIEEPRLALHYFPPVRLAPGETHYFPAARVIVYEGDWRPAARAYREWHSQAFRSLRPPQWFRESDGETGAHFHQRREPPTRFQGGHGIRSWCELPELHLAYPVDAWEYAFYCRLSMVDADKPFTPHTDGVNVIREDLGGAEVMREGIAGVHGLGLHAMLYVDGYIVHENSELARDGLAQRWAVVHRDGTRTGPYSHQGYLHMCAGSSEWQDHLAATVARLLRETGADGVRVDSLGFYYLPCYNPEHNHASPFGYNEWLKQLLRKVRNAAFAVKPDALLLVEGPADWLTPYVHGALTARSPRELPPMRIAVGPFRPYVYASGTLWASVAGFAGAGGGGGITSPEWNWTCAQSAVHEALVWGDVRDDPTASDPEIVARCFTGNGYLAIVAARPACQDPIWPWGTSIASGHSPYVLTLRDSGDVEDAVVCDVETLTWSPLSIERTQDGVRLSLTANWALIVLRRPGGPRVIDFDPLPQAERGSVVKLDTIRVVGTGGGSARVVAPGLVVTVDRSGPPGAVTIRVPNKALPGNYAVRLAGKGLLCTKRFLTVR